MKFAWLVATLALAITVSARPRPSDGPEVVSAVAPPFPAIAATAKATGDVIVEVKIDSHGNVASADAVAGHPLLKKVCEATAKRWKFGTARAGENERIARLTFSFRVLDKADAFEMAAVFFPPYRIEIATVKPKIETVTVH